VPTQRRALLAVDHRRNAELLADWLEREHGFDVTDQPTEAFDVAIVDTTAMRRLEPELRRRRDQARPAWLPVLLILPRRDPPVRDATTTSVWELADDVLTTPARRQDLSVRLERLLALRDRSIVLASRLDELGRSNTDLEQFAYVAAHELSTPLSVVTGAVETIAALQRDKLDPQFRRLLDAARLESDRLQTLIQDLLDFARTGQSTRLEPIDLDEVLAEALDTLRPQIEACGAHIESTSIPKVPGDARQLRMVFVNLVGNALKYRSDEQPRVRISAEERAHSVIVAVEDNGRGVASNRRRAIFEMFERSDGGRTLGHGIGLALCRRVIERHDGRIWVEPAIANGAIFKFELPTARR
jgi:signal transduction histidine kinase